MKAPDIKQYPYQVTDSRTNTVIGYYQTLARATRAVDRLDNAYGAYRYRAERRPKPIGNNEPKPL